MLAAITTAYGAPDVLKIMDVAKPEPKPDEVVVRVHASSVTAADMMMRRGAPFYGRLFIGLFKPKSSTPGTGFAGEVAEIGSKVSKFKVGDRVFGEALFGHGTNAEFTAVSEDGLVMKMPDDLSYEAAATLSDGPVTSMNFLKRLVDVGPGQRVLIIGASGSLGTAAVQLASQYGAHVTGVTSAANAAMVQALGADQVIDYTKADFTESSQRWDVVYDTIGKSSFAKSKSVLTKEGAYLSPVLGGTLWDMIRTSKFGKKRAKFSATGLLPETELKQMLEDVLALVISGALEVVIDRRYPLDQIVEAHKYVELGHKKGNVVLEGPDDGELFYS